MLKKNKNEHEIETIEQKPLLDVQNLNMSFKIRGLYFEALKNISFSVNKGDFFGIIGESGSGKSTTGKCIIKLYQPTGGKIEIDNHLVSNKRLSRKTNKWLKKNVQMIFQDPMASLNPTKNVLQLISEPLVINKTIYKDAFKQWKKLNNVAKYYLLDFKQQKNALKYHFEHNYLSVLNAKIKKFVDNFEDGFNPSDSFKVSREKLIFKMDTLVEKIQENSGEINSFIKKSQELIDELVARYNREDYNETFKNYEHNLMHLKVQKNIYKYSVKGTEIQKEINKRKHELNAYKNEFEETYIKQNFGYIKSWETTIRSNIKTLKQSLYFSKNTIDYSINFINLTIQKFLLIFVKALEKNSFLEENIINNTIKKSQEIVEKLFKILNQKVLNLSLKFDNASVDEKNNIIEILLATRMFATCFYKNFKENNWDNYDHVKKQFDDIHAKCPKYNEYDEDIKIHDFNVNQFDDFLNHNNEFYKELRNMLDFLTNSSLETKNRYTEKVIAISEQIKNIKKEFKEVCNNYHKNFNELETNKEKYTISLHEFNKAKNARQHYLENVVLAPLSEQEIQKNLNEKLNIKNLRLEQKNLMKLLKVKIGYVLKMINKQINESNLESQNIKGIKKIFFNFSFVKYLKREIILRKKTLDALNFEFKNSVREMNINSFIFEKSRMINWILLPSLVDLIKKDLVYKALDSVGLKREHAYRYPHEFSGGQRQRIVIARALINNPKVIIADEPISALDVSIQAQIINILQDLCKNKNVTILFIAHDLSMVNYACNNVIIMHRGRILEKGDVNKIFANPIHPYTRSLMKATPKLSRVHVDLAAFNEDFTYDKDWSIFNKPKFIKINNDNDHEVYGTEDQVKLWIKQAKNNKDDE